MPTVEDPTPRARTSSPVRLIGYGAVVLLILAIILLATGVFDFEQRAWFQ